MQAWSQALGTSVNKAGLDLPQGAYRYVEEPQSVRRTQKSWTTDVLGAEVGTLSEVL